MSSSKTDTTVFCKFPSSSGITRFHLEDRFGQVGPIKKCSVIAESGYGFVRYVSQEDAQAAAKTLDGIHLEVDGKSLKVKVELASSSSSSKRAPPTDNAPVEENVQRKRTSRVIVRNLSFYANESNVKRILEAEYGKVAEVHLPRVSDKTHRGFCFVTFERARDAQKAVAPRAEPLLIKKRPVAIDFSTPKVVHQQMKNQMKQQEKEKEEERNGKSDDDSDGSSSSEVENDSEEQDNGKDDSDQDDDTSTTGDETNDDGDDKEATATPDNSVPEGCTLFLRNLPFDATRHDVFKLFSRFGYITSVYLVKDKETGVAKGTAFLSFQHKHSAQKALDASGAQDGAFVTQRNVSDEGLLYLNGRRVLCDLAVDKETAATLVSTNTHTHGKDRRNLYLKLEGRVANLADGAAAQAWENLPSGDQLKRQRAFADKNTKLRSPLFFINPNRLSVRNLAKHVDEASLKQLCVDGITRGLKQKLVTADDQVAHWKASGDVSSRDVMEKLGQQQQVIPEFDDKNVKQFVPSVYIDRENMNSRGFGFVEFLHHAHALACLRELNNNPFYSADYCAGGKKVVDAKKASKKKKRKQQSGDDDDDDDAVRIPRLIVEFTVENKAKAKKQAENRAQQQANVEKQKLEQKEKQKAEPKKERKSRGKAQRERKRKQRVEGKGESTTPNQEEPVVEETKRPIREKIKMVKPPKKRKVDKEDQDFETMVQSYKAAFAGVSEAKKTDETKARRKEVATNRWFD